MSNVERIKKLCNFDPEKEQIPRMSVNHFPSPFFIEKQMKEEKNPANNYFMIKGSNKKFADIKDALYFGKAFAGYKYIMKNLLLGDFASALYTMITTNQIEGFYDSNLLISKTSQLFDPTEVGKEHALSFHITCSIKTIYKLTFGHFIDENGESVRGVEEIIDEGKNFLNTCFQLTGDPDKPHKRPMPTPYTLLVEEVKNGKKPEPFKKIEQISQPLDVDHGIGIGDSSGKVKETMAVVIRLSNSVFPFTEKDKTETFLNESSERYLYKPAGRFVITSLQKRLKKSQ